MSAWRARARGQPGARERMSPAPTERHVAPSRPRKSWSTKVASAFIGDEGAGGHGQILGMVLRGAADTCKATRVFTRAGGVTCGAIPGTDSHRGRSATPGTPVKRIRTTPPRRKGVTRRTHRCVSVERVTSGREARETSGLTRLRLGALGGGRRGPQVRTPGKPVPRAELLSRRHSHLVTGPFDVRSAVPAIMRDTFFARRWRLLLSTC